MAGSAKYSPVFVKAKDEEELQDKLLLMQLKDYKQYKYLTIYPTKDGLVAWLYKDNSVVDTMKDALR